MSMLRSQIPASWIAVSLIALLGLSGQVLADPPMRVARVSYISGDVSMQPAGLDEWSQALINRPMSTGDALYLDRASLAELDIGAATVRIDERTSLRILELDDQRAQIELTAGTLNLTVRNVYEGQYYEIDTPTLALVVEEPGIYRVDISPAGDSTMISVVDGAGTVYGQNDTSYRVERRKTYRFNDPSLNDYQIFGLPDRDEFDQWCLERAQRYDQSLSRRYVSEDVIGYSDLDEYGTWGQADTYGSVWYPSQVEAGWAPYRNGHWAWIDPWGWTWVDNSPWGFAPFHYGRWAFVGSRWGWVPGPRIGRAVYAPALVAFVGGGGFSVGISTGPIGWFPLGPRDVYVPWYNGSRNYFNNVNVRNTTVINNTYITNVYNDYSNGRPINNGNYAYRDNDRAVTAVSRDTFVNARSVDLARVRVNRAELQQAQVVSRIQVAPTTRSFTGGSAARGNGGAAVRNADFERTVIARTAPPARTPNAEARIQAISRNDNQPLAQKEMRELSARKPRTAEKDVERVQVVGEGRVNAARAKPLPAKSPAETQGRATPAPVNREQVSREQQSRKPADTQVKERAPTNPTTERQARPVTNSSGRNASPATGKPAERSNPEVRSETPTRTGVQSGVVTSPRSKPTSNVPRPPSQQAPEQTREAQPSKAPSRSQPSQRAPQQNQPREVQPRSTQESGQVQKAPATTQQQRREVQPRQVQQQPAQQPQQRQSHEAQPRQVQQQPAQQPQQRQSREVQPRQVQQQPVQQPKQVQGREAQPPQGNQQRQERKSSKSDSDEDKDEKKDHKQRGG